MEEIRKAHKILAKKLKEIHFGDIEVNGRILLEWMLEK
jgi:hypothetical protein